MSTSSSTTAMCGEAVELNGTRPDAGLAAPDPAPARLRVAALTGAHPPPGAAREARSIVRMRRARGDAVMPADVAHVGRAAGAGLDDRGDHDRRRQREHADAEDRHQRR